MERNFYFNTDLDSSFSTVPVYLLLSSVPIRIRRICKFFSFQDPDPSVRGKNLDPSIIRKKY
jgi:hypothetical protein